MDSNVIENVLYKLKGINRDTKKAYQALFNSKENKNISKKVIDDLIIRFKYYGAPATDNTILLAKQAAYREIIEYILTMSARISDDTLLDIEQFINK